MKHNYISVIICLALPLMVVGTIGCNSKHDSAGSQEYSEEDDEVELTIEEAKDLISWEGSGDTSSEDMFEPFRIMNLYLYDSEAAHNMGSEPLAKFAEHFSNDITFQKRRTRLIEGSTYIPDYYNGLLQILLPDSTNFFASWSEIEDDKASFCNGWLGSEMNKEYVFRREKDGKWYLIEFFSAVKEY